MRESKRHGTEQTKHNEMDWCVRFYKTRSPACLNIQMIKWIGFRNELVLFQMKRAEWRDRRSTLLLTFKSSEAKNHQNHQHNQHNQHKTIENATKIECDALNTVLNVQLMSISWLLCRSFLLVFFFFFSFFFWFIVVITNHVYSNSTWINIVDALWPVAHRYW